MYLTLLYLHSWGRWLVLLAGLWAVARAFSGWQKDRAYLTTDNRSAVFFIGMLHLQLLVGLLLYFVYNPSTAPAFQNFGAAMKNRELRFWAVEHFTMMIAAVAVAQVGRIRSKKALSDLRKHSRAFYAFLFALLLILLMIPWGIYNPMRPLLRL